MKRPQKGHIPFKNSRTLLKRLVLFNNVYFGTTRIFDQ